MSTNIRTWYDFVLQQMAAESYLDQSNLFGGTLNPLKVLMYGRD